MRNYGRRAVSAAAILGTALAAGLATQGSSEARTAESAQAGVSGRFSLVMMIHTRSSSFGDLPGVNPWDGRRVANTRFSYRSIPCVGNAPVNNIASDLPSYGTRVAGSRAPSSMRAHPFAFKVRRNKKTRKWEMQGTITFTVCRLGPGPNPLNDPVADANKPRIRVGFRSRFLRETAEGLRFHGTFRIKGGTGRYDDLSGSGELGGYLMCFAPEGCAKLGGKYLDGQFTMQGTYRDPTPDLAAG